jgi:hypothetical protein
MAGGAAKPGCSIPKTRIGGRCSPDHPHSPGDGRKSLYFDPGKICHLVGIADEDLLR